MMDERPAERAEAQQPPESQPPDNGGAGAGEHLLSQLVAHLRTHHVTITCGPTQLEINTT